MRQPNKQMRMLLPLSDMERVLLDEFASLDVSDSATISLTFVSVEDGDVRFRRAELGPRIAGDLRGIVARVLTDLEKRIYNSGVTVRPYNRAAKLDDHELEYLVLSEHRDLLGQIAPLKKPKQLELLVDDDLHDPRIRYYVISIRPAQDEPWLHCFRIMTEGSQPRRTKLLVWKGHGEEYFDTLSSPVYLLDPRNIDCLLRGDHMFIIDMDKFEHMFELAAEDVQARAQAVFDSVARSLPFVNRDQFTSACENDPKMAAKVARMQGQPHLDLLSVERAKLAKERFDLDIEFDIGADGTEMLKFVPKYKWQYVSILGDEYLTSPMTGLDYESNSKHPIKARTLRRVGRTSLQELQLDRTDNSAN